MTRSVAIIGSFKTAERYARVIEAIDVFRRAGWIVTSPAGADAIEHGIDFVRFSTDDPEHTDAEVQTHTLARIFKADIVLVIAPDGYIGRTTCYEIGRVVQAGRPIFFTEAPKDLPIKIDAKYIMSPAETAQQLGEQTPPHLFEQGDTPLHQVERELIGA